MIKLERKEVKGDRSRKRISTPREQVIPVFNDGMVTVETAFEGVARTLEQKGFTRMPGSFGHAGRRPTVITKPAVSTPAPAAVPAAVKVADLGVRALKALARERKIEGRGKMSRDELVAALS